MSRRRALSPQASSVLASLAERPSEWRHGYDLCVELGISSGTLYPLLMRLSDRGLLEASWEPSPPLGRPRRHLYRVTSQGVRAAAAAAAQTASPLRQPRL